MRGPERQDTLVLIGQNFRIAFSLHIKQFLVILIVHLCSPGFATGVALFSVAANIHALTLLTQ